MCARTSPQGRACARAHPGTVAGAPHTAPPPQPSPSPPPPPLPPSSGLVYAAALIDAPPSLGTGVGTCVGTPQHRTRAGSFNPIRRFSAIGWGAEPTAVNPRQDHEKIPYLPMKRVNKSRGVAAVSRDGWGTAPGPRRPRDPLNALSVDCIILHQYNAIDCIILHYIAY